VEEVAFKVPGLVERFVPVVAEQLRQAGDDRGSEVLLAASVEVVEDVECDSWEGGTHGHNVLLAVPVDLCMGLGLDERDRLEGQCELALNRHVRVRGEYIHGVLITIGETSAAVQPPRQAPRDTDASLWGPQTEFLRLFVSHLSDDKLLASDLKEACEDLGIYCFVAHEDIEPTKQWLFEIERALHCMDCLLALVTPGFGNSKWTDQEVGWAMGRGACVIPVHLGCDPYGFMGKYQAVPGVNRPPRTLAEEILAALLQPGKPTRRQMQTGLVARFEHAASFSDANRLIGVLMHLDHLPRDLVDRLEAAPERNSQVSGAFDVQRHLNRLVKRMRGA